MVNLAIRFTLDSSESRGFFLFFPPLMFSLFRISKADFVLLKMKFDNHFTHLAFWILHELDMIEP